MNNTFQNIGLHTSGQDIDPFYFSKYRPPYFWTRYRSFFTFQNIGLHTSGQDIRSFFTFQNIGLHTSGQDIDPFLLSKISASILLDKI